MVRCGRSPSHLISDNVLAPNPATKFLSSSRLNTAKESASAIPSPPFLISEVMIPFSNKKARTSSLGAFPVTDRDASLVKREPISVGGLGGSLGVEGDDRYVSRVADERWVRNLG